MSDLLFREYADRIDVVAVISQPETGKGRAKLLARIIKPGLIVKKSEADRLDEHQLTLLTEYLEKIQSRTKLVDAASYSLFPETVSRVIDHFNRLEPGKERSEAIIILSDAAARLRRTAR